MKTEGKETQIKKTSLLSGLVFLFVLAHFAHHLLLALLVPLLPFIRDDFKLDYVQAGWLVSAFSLSYGISHLPAGWLCDRLGPRLPIVIGISGVALAGLLVGLAPNYGVMASLLVLLGITGGGYHPASAPLVSASVEPGRGGWALGLHQIGGTASHFLAPLIAVAVASVLKWRGPFITLSFPTLLFGIVPYIIMRRRTQTQSAGQKAVASHAENSSVRGALSRLVAFLILTTFGYTLTSAVISFVPLFVIDHWKSSKEEAAVLLALVYSAGLWAGPLGGFLSDRLGSVRVTLAVSLLAAPIIYLLSIVPRGLGASAVLLGVGMSLYLRMPVAEAYIIRNTSQRFRGLVLGIYYFGSRGGPGVLTPVIGYLIDRFSFTTSFIVTAFAMLVVTLISAVFLWGRQE